MTARMNWREDAACGDADPDMFFPLGTTGNALRRIDEAKRICRRCPAQIQGLAWALENGVAKLIAQQGTENMEYVRNLLRKEQPGFSAMLELALVLAELELWPSPQMPRDTSAATAHDQ